MSTALRPAKSRRQSHRRPAPTTPIICWPWPPTRPTWWRRRRCCPALGSTGRSGSICSGRPGPRNPYRAGSRPVPTRRSPPAHARWSRSRTGRRRRKRARSGGYSVAFLRATELESMFQDSAHRCERRPIRAAPSVGYATVFGGHLCLTVNRSSSAERSGRGSGRE